jgi:hypothetical protein
VEVDINQPALAPIDVEFVVAEGLQENTEAKRRPYVKLIRRWAQRQGSAEQGEAVVGRLALDGGSKVLTDLRHLPNEVSKKYREGDKAEQLVKFVREIDGTIKLNSNWTWAHVMRVMMDEGILMTNIPNRFDVLICSMIPGKGSGTVRKNGDYSLIETKRSWRDWIENYRDDWDEANNRAICKEIFEFLEPLFS